MVSGVYGKDSSFGIPIVLETAIILLVNAVVFEILYFDLFFYSCCFSADTAAIQAGVASFILNFITGKFKYKFTV